MRSCKAFLRPSHLCRTSSKKVVRLNLASNQLVSCPRILFRPFSTDFPIDGFKDVPGVQAQGDKMVIMFTCTVCDTRSARKISKRAYTDGIVMVRCAGCNNRHLIADRMGVFEDSIPDSNGDLKPGTGWDIQKYLAKETGVTSKYITDENVFELTAQDILGAKAAAAVNLEKEKENK